jgi:hypothetical protein
MRWTLPLPTPNRAATLSMPKSSPPLWLVVKFRPNERKPAFVFLIEHDRPGIEHDIWRLHRGVRLKEATALADAGCQRPSSLLGEEPQVFILACG